MTPGKMIFTTCYLNSSYLYIHRSNVAFADEQNVRHKLSTALTLPPIVTNNRCDRFTLFLRIMY